jgi:MIP family channel proteins
MLRLLPALVAEAIGVFALSFIGILAIHDAPAVGLVGVALAHGLILSIMITAFAAVSGGHLNPAVTIGLAVGGKIKGPDAIAYIVAQCLGGFLAGLAMLAIFKSGDASGIILGGTPTIETVNKGLTATPWHACVAEIVATFFLVTAVWGTAVDPRAPKIGGFGIGLTVTADILALGPVTGAAMNPARAFGPALAGTLARTAGTPAYDWADHWIYWVGPVLGGILASIIYRHIIYPKNAS